MEIENKIDEGLYSRQIYVLGEEAMKKMTTSKVLLIGLKGLGVEIAKNVILTGVKSVTLYDNEPVQIRDMSTNFYLTEDVIGQPRAQCCLEKLSELNRYVPVDVYSGELNEEFLKNFRVIVYTQMNGDEEVRIDTICHNNNICFISTSTNGVCGKIFCDFGDDFIVMDQDCEDPKSVMVGDISHDEEGTVTVLEGRHDFEDGDMVTFSDIRGMTELNGCDPRPVKVLGPLAFNIGDTTNFHEYHSHGWCTQVKQPKTLHFKSLQDSLYAPGEFLITDYGKFESSSLLHICYIALSRYIAVNNRYPKPWNTEDATAFINICKEVNSQMNNQYHVSELNENFLGLFAKTCQGDISPITAAFGGIVAQEVLKACSAKFTPIYQYMYMDQFEALPTDINEEDCQPQNSRYDGQIMLFGQQLQSKLENLRFFLVGAGAIGCEVIKNFALMGLSTGSKGHIYITDMDRIEKSNLSRQFLFRPKDIGQSKAVTAGHAVKSMNKDMKITTYETKVGKDTEDVFSDMFIDSLDGICNALDNVEARLYMDSRCVQFQKCLLESGTLGAKGNTQIVVPFKTQNYGASRDPEEKGIPVCTLKNFPYKIEHTIQWARDYFEGVFRQSAESVNGYIHNSHYIDDQRANPATFSETIKILYDSIVTSRPTTFNDCIKWATLKFHDLYYIQIRQLLHKFPADFVTANGEPFWSGHKRAPAPITFDINNKLHMDFVMATAYLFAAMYDIPHEENSKQFYDVIPSVILPEFVPDDSVVINADESSTAGNSIVADKQQTETLISELPKSDSLSNLHIIPLEFEKDDDSNHHIDFITACSNLRATCYDIPVADRQTTKRIAGKIIPAIATTTSLVTGFICLELYKLLLNKDIESFRNLYANLSLPLFCFTEPVPCETFESCGNKWSIWDRIDIGQPNDGMTFGQLIENIETKYEVSIDMISVGTSLVYSSWGNKKNMDARKLMTIKEMVESVSKKPVLDTQKYVVFDCLCTKDDEETDLPSVYYPVH